ncbi:MAG TPA: hypothetical protein VFR18_14840 [Terriglobia bacterium]|nr:hypothetical protein [Terriglobia bacterium]
MRYTLVCYLAVTLLLLSACSSADQPETNTPTDAAAPATSANPHAGTWTLNVGKSSYSPGPAPKSQTLKIESWGDDGLTYVADGVGADDKPTHSEFQAKFDEKDYEFKGNPDADMLSYSKVDANTLHATLKRKGAAVITAHVVVSPDGKTRTVTQSGKDAQGRDVKIVSVYEKQ